jgi:lipopolysaccharide export system permease protein
LLQRLDKYIISETWLPFVSGAGIITGVWLGIDKFKEVFKLLAKSGASFMTGFVILGLEIPQILAITIPISILLATFLSFQKLSAQSEIIAMRSAGLSMVRLIKPVMILGLLGSLVSFSISEFVVPFTNPFAQKVYMLALYEDPINTKSQNGFSYFEKDSDGDIKRIFYVKKIKDEILRDIVILDFSTRGSTMIHSAKQGRWQPEQGGWVLTSGTSSYLKTDENQSASATQPGKTTHLVSEFQQTLIPSSINPNEILAKISNVRDMNFYSLYKFIMLHEKQGIDSDKLNELKTKYYNKYSYPLSCVLLAVIGAVLGIVGRRRVVNWGYIAIGLIVFVFYMSQTMFESLGYSGRVAPELAVWMPNFILAFFAFVFFMYRARLS